MHNDALFWKAIWWHSSQNWRFLLQDSSNHGPWGFAFKFHNLLLMLKFWASTFPLWLACCHKEVVGNKGWSNQSCRAGSSAPGPRTITCPWTLGHGHVATGPRTRTPVCLGSPVPTGQLPEGWSSSSTPLPTAMGRLAVGPRQARVPRQRVEEKLHWHCCFTLEGFAAKPWVKCTELRQPPSSRWTCLGWQGGLKLWLFYWGVQGGVHEVFLASPLW